MSDHEDPNRTEVLENVPNELEALLVVNALAANGIRAKAAGVYTAGFQAGAPAQVQILMADGERDEARKLLAEIRDNAKDRHAREFLSGSEFQTGSAMYDPSIEEEETFRQGWPKLYTVFVMLVGLMVMQAWLGEDQFDWEAVVHLAILTAYFFWLVTPTPSMWHQVWRSR